MKKVEMSEAWPDTFNEGYIHQFQPEPTHKIHSSNRNTEFKDILPNNISQMFTKAIPISTRIIISYAMKQTIQLWVWLKVNRNWDNNMTRIFDVLTNFLFTTSETMHDYYLETWYIQVVSQVAKQLKT